MTGTSAISEPASESAAAKVSFGAKVAAPVVAGAAMWAVREFLNFGFRRVTGRPAPSASDTTIAPRQILGWAAVTAVAVTAVNVGVDRALLRPRVGTALGIGRRHDRPGAGWLPLSARSKTVLAGCVASPAPFHRTEGLHPMDEQRLRHLTRPNDISWAQLAAARWPPRIRPAWRFRCVRS